jgi:hypothetical protein
VDIRWRGALAVCVALVGAQLAVATPASAAADPVAINEIESNGGVPGDWVELINNGTAAVDLTGWVVRDNDDTHVYAIPSGSTIAAGGYYVADVDPVFGLGSADSARLFAPDGTLVDSYAWTAHAATTYGRCPNGTGPFITTTSSTTRGESTCSAGR